MVLLYEQGGLDVLNQFPHVVALRVSHPFYEILQLFLLSMTSVVMDGLDFILFVVIDEVRWWPQEVFAVFYCFDI